MSQSKIGNLELFLSLKFVGFEWCIREHIVCSRNHTLNLCSVLHEYNLGLFSVKQSYKQGFTN